MNAFKRCTACGEALPATVEFFSPHKVGRHGLHPRCKTCRSANGRDRHKTLEQRGYIIPDEKQCTACGNVLPATKEYFPCDKNRTDGLFPHCKQCKKNYDQIHYGQPEVNQKKRAYQRVYYHTPGIHERVLLQAGTYRKLPHVQERIYAYRHSARGLILYRAHCANRYALKKMVLGTHTSEQIRSLLKRQRHRCYYCTSKFQKVRDTYRYHIDHTFPLSRVAGSDIPANDISYLVLTCPTCNLKKHDRFPWEWPEGGKLL